MKGTVFAPFGDVVAKSDGDRARDTLLDKAGLDGGDSMIGNRRDAELLDLVGARAETLTELLA